LKNQYQELKFHIEDIPNKVSFQHLKLNLISNNSSNITNSANLSSTNLIHVINGNHEPNALNISNLNSQNLISYSNKGKFSFLS